MGIVLALGVFIGVRGGVTQRWDLSLAIVVALALMVALVRREARVIALCALLGCALGLVCGYWWTPRQAPFYDGPLPGVVRGVVANDPRTSFDGVRADIRWMDPTGRTRVSRAALPSAPLVGRGDRLEFGGFVADPLQDQLQVSAMRVIAGPGRLERERQRARVFVSNALLRDVPGSPGTLALGLLLGDDSGLTSAERGQLRQAGMSHITAVSGWNVSIVIAGVGAFCLALGLRGRWWALGQLAALVGYVWLVGGEPPVVRAALMTASAFAATQLGRPRHTLTALALTAAALACVTPATLATLSFQLSALATLGVAIALQWTPRWSGMRAAVLGPALVSACAGLATAPLLASAFGTFTLASIPSNVVAGPLVNLATFAGALVAPLSALGLGEPVALATWFACWLLLEVAAVFAVAPVGHWTFAPLSSGAVAGMYALLALGGAMLLPEGRLARRRLRVWALAEPLPAACASLMTLTVCALALITL